MGCGKKLEKAKLLRFVRQEDATLLFDLRQREKGRGGYMCPRRPCFHVAAKKKRLTVRFRRDVRDDPSSMIKTVLETIEKESAKWNGSQHRALEAEKQAGGNGPGEVSEPVRNAMQFYSEFISGGSSEWPK